MKKKKETKAEKPEEVLEEEQQEEASEEAEDEAVFRQAPTQNYFSQDIEKMISEMSEKEMFRELINLEETRAWIAILKYNQIRLQQSQSAIFAGDPIKDPSSMLRNQGVMLGLSDLQNAVILLKQDRDNQNK
jgi:hypothetical protein